ncbi:MAG: magnesium transporter [Planctomycetes bacterium]|nr:magnesium transporter [Planctomycetota bacterium]
MAAADRRGEWAFLPPEERVREWRALPRDRAEDLFVSLSTHDQAEFLLTLPPEDRRSLVRLLPPDDAADLVQEAPLEVREAVMALMDEPTRREVTALLAYKEDEAGGLMNPRYAHLRPDMTVDEAIVFLRRQAQHLETIYYVYVLDDQQRLVGVISFRELFAAQPDRKVREVMKRSVVAARADQDQEALSRVFAEHDFLAIPVVDGDGKMKGIVTFDDIVDVVHEEGTEDAQKFGGMEALDAPYLKTAFSSMVRKRAGWLAVLFLGETLTASAMTRFEDQIAKWVVLALFVPLIISSGGNAGSQASTLAIRAMALGEVSLRDWWRVVRRELAMGLVLGATLGAIGFLRIVLWPPGDAKGGGPHYMAVALAIFGSLVGVVTLGTFVGSFLPFVLRRLGFDPASASAPFVSTVVDVTGLIIYFTIATLVLGSGLF